MPTQLHSIDVVEVVKDVGSISANTTTEITFTINGVRSDDFVVASKPSLDAGLVVGSSRVSSDNTVSVTISNPTAGAVDPGSETYRFLVLRPTDVHTDSLVP